MKAKIAVTCGTCQRSVSRRNMARHLRLKHPWLPVAPRGRPSRRQVRSEAGDPGPIASAPRHEGTDRSPLRFLADAAATTEEDMVVEYGAPAGPGEYHWVDSNENL